MNRRFVLALVSLVLTLSISAQSPALHVRDKFRMPVNETLYSSCAGEEIALRGWVHVHYHALELPGGFRAVSTSNYHNVVGVGLVSGARYRLIGTNISEVDFRRPFPRHSLFNLSVRLLRDGGGLRQDSHFHLFTRFTMNGRGRVTSSLDRIVDGCR
jgi:hypothetical protein